MTEAVRKIWRQGSDGDFLHSATPKDHLPVQVLVDLSPA